MWEVQERDENANSFLAKTKRRVAGFFVAEKRRHMASGAKGSLCVKARQP